jgi:hypothetical protein
MMSKPDSRRALAAFMARQRDLFPTELAIAKAAPHYLHGARRGATEPAAPGAREREDGGRDGRPSR